MRLAYVECACNSHRSMRIFGLFVLLSVPVAIYACADGADDGVPGATDAARDATQTNDGGIEEDGDKKDASKPDASKLDAAIKDAAAKDVGQEGDPCALGASQLQACGKCGQQERVCLTGPDGGGGWSSWGKCEGEATAVDACDPAATPAEQACGNCGRQTLACDSLTCKLSTGLCIEPVFSGGVAACPPTSQQFKFGAGCTNPNEGRFSTCNATCMWGTFGACENVGVPTPGIRGYVGGTTAECALSSTGAVYCWGSDSYGQLGDGATVSTSTGPAFKVVQVQNVSDAQVIAGGNYFSCAIETGGGIKCWGNNTFQEIPGTGLTKVESAITVPGITGATAITSGGYYACALLAGGTVKCWGSGPGASALFQQGNVPVALSNAADLIDLAASSTDICGITSSRTVVCWNASNPTTPVTIANIPAAEEVRLGIGFGCARIHGGGVRCWDSNSEGQLGDGTTTNSKPATAVAVQGLTDAASLYIGYGGFSSCVLTTAKKVMCWGDLGGIYTKTPTEHAGYPANAEWLGLSGSYTLVGYSASSGFYTASLLTTDTPVKFGSF